MMTRKTNQPLTNSSIRFTNHADSILEMYFKEVRRYPLLTAQQEVELTQKMRQGDPRSKDRLVCSNLRFVITIAKRFQTNDKPLLDLIEEGTIGLIQAVEKFDPTKGIRLCSFAAWWIQRSIQRYKDTAEPLVRLPMYVIDLRNKALAEINRREQNGECPVLDEVAEALNESVEDIQMALSYSKQHKSLDEPVGEEEDGSTTCLGDLIENEDSLPADAYVKQTDFRIALQQAMDSVKLPARDQRILREMYGLDGTPKSKETIALEENLTVERVRQIGDTACKKLRRCTFLLAYYEQAA